MQVGGAVIKRNEIRGELRPSAIAAAYQRNLKNKFKDILTTEISVGSKMYFGYLYDGCLSCCDEALESGHILLENGTGVTFRIIESADDALDSIIEIIDIY